MPGIRPCQYLYLIGKIAATVREPSGAPNHVSNLARDSSVSSEVSWLRRQGRYGDAASRLLFMRTWHQVGIRAVSTGSS